MLNPQEILVLIRDEIKTEEIRSLSFDKADSKCAVVFHSEKAYKYNSFNVVCLKNPKQHDFSGQKIYAEGKELCGIKSILEFKNSRTGKRYWHIVLKNGAKTYKYDELKVLNNSKEDTSNEVLNYLKEVAANNPLQVQEHLGNSDKAIDVSLLEKQYEKIRDSYKNDDTTLAFYLKSDIKEKPSLNADQSLIFPFGCNLSQINAVQNAFKYKISLIQGPPGTGKTQTILNILANLLVQGKTALVVSNNNSAIKNVQEKLSQYRLDFLSAMLGSGENKAAFIDAQSNTKIDIPIVDSNRDLRSWKTDVLQKIADAKTYYKEQNELARANVEYENAKVNYEHFKDFLGDLGLLDYIPENRKGLDYLKIEGIRWLIEGKIKKNPSKNKLSYPARFGLRFLDGLTNWKFLKGDVTVVLAALEKLCYVTLLSDYEKRISELTSSLKTKTLIVADLLEFSKTVLYDSVSQKFGSRKNPTTYTIEDLYRKWEDFLKDYPIVFSTTFASKSALNSKAVFDYVIMDESSQVDIATGALALSCAKNAVVVGDSKQLEKVTTKDEREKYNEIFQKHHVPQMYNCVDLSFLESISRFIPKDAQTLLREHYRCHTKIIEFCNQKFYDNQLIVHSKNNEKNPLIVHWTAPTSQENNINQKQIEAISQEILPKLKTGDVGIISPYRNQCRELSKIIPDLDISTIHKFQGREKDTIIFSTVDNVLTEFSGDPQIINVAVSRAKNQFILVAPKQDQPKGSLLDDLIGYIQYNAGVSEDSKIYSIFDFLFNQNNGNVFDGTTKISKYPTENAAYGMICSVLKKCPSLNVHFEYPMNHLIRDFSRIKDDLKLLNYARHPATHIDFLITNKITKTPVLAVEIDGANFHKAESVQGLRDRMKNTILERYGIDYIRFSTKGCGECELLTNKLKAYICH